MKSLTVRNDTGDIVAKLYIEKNGDLHPDSWLCHEGWEKHCREKSE